MKSLKQRLWQRAAVATVTGLGVALAMVGSAKPAQASSVDWGVTIHIGGHDDGYRHRDRYYDPYYNRDYRRHDYDDYRYRPSYGGYGGSYGGYGGYSGGYSGGYGGGYVYRDRDDYRSRDRGRDDRRYRGR